ncbi:hypothetical protein [Demequina aurantiaca]|uniref:hypothetical protein n=1 Tax=Demequina aurantiaca TaxID=676200 RepID=UPI003D33AD18
MDDINNAWWLVYSISLIAFLAILVVPAVASIVFGAMALFAGSRETVFARYPLRVMTWILVTPVFVGALLIAFGSALTLTSQLGALDPNALLFGAVDFATLALCPVAIVMCSRAATGWYERGPWTPAILGFVAPLFATVAALSTGGWWLLLVTLVISISAGVNGLLAVGINRRRRVVYETPLPVVAAPSA